MTRGRGIGAVVAAGLWGLPAVASAHMRLSYPEPRTTSALLPGPCGSGEVTGGRTVLLPGATITVQWATEIPHYGYYFVRFGPNDDAGFDDYELAMIEDDAAQVDYAVEVTLPECSCTDCTLQIWQTPPSLDGGYYTCADIELRPIDALDVAPCPMATVEPGEGGDSTGGDPSGTDSGGPSDDSSGGTSAGDGGDDDPPGTFDAGGSSSDGGDTGGDSSGGASEGGGCRIGGTSVPVPAWLVLGLLAARRRRE